MIATVYRAILRLYLAPHREVFGAEMAATFEEALTESRLSGFGYVCFVTDELAGLLSGLLAEWAVRWKNGADYLRRCHPAAEASDSERQLRQLIQRMEFAIAHHDFRGARRYCHEERELRQRMQAAHGMRRYRAVKSALP